MTARHLGYAGIVLTLLVLAAVLAMLLGRSSPPAPANVVVGNACKNQAEQDVYDVAAVMTITGEGQTRTLNFSASVSGDNFHAVSEYVNDAASRQEFMVVDGVSYIKSADRGPGWYQQEFDTADIKTRLGLGDDPLCPPVDGSDYTAAGTETLDGVSTTKYTSTGSGGVQGQSGGGALAQGAQGASQRTESTTLWVTGNGTLKQFRLNEQGGGTGAQVQGARGAQGQSGASSSWTMDTTFTISEVGVANVISAPTLAQVPATATPFPFPPTPAPTPTPTPTPTPLPEIVDRYNTNDDGIIDKYEYRHTLQDYSSGKITYAQLQEVRANYYRHR